MCGIAGGYFKNVVERSNLRNAADAMEHRGPDASGYYFNEPGTVFLGHRRLSIIDLSETANQPMHSGDGRYVMVYNGEIYNFKKLRDKLPEQQWLTYSDTEVILELFAAFGAQCFAWFNGIFALAIYDTRDEKLWLCRDQLGIKPLFIRRSDTQLFFASELKAVVKQVRGETGKAPAIDRRAIPYFLHLGYIPQPLTIYTGIEKFPAGHYAVLDINKNSWNTTRFWDAKTHYLSEPIHNEAQASKLYKEKLFAAVDRQMVGDVPLGTFLSGGIDSSLVTAVAADLGKSKVSTFSIGFDEPGADESLYANQVAHHLKTDHHLFKVKFDDILGLVPEFLSVYDEPFADSSAFPTMLVSKLARQNVTVTLSGDGGDELFQGYGMYRWAKRLHDPKLRLSRKPLSFVMSRMNERFQRAGKLFEYQDINTLPSHIFSQEQYFFSEKELNNLLLDEPFNFETLNNLPNKGLPEEEQAFWDIEHYLKDDLLVKVDRASMHYSLETRVPLLDMELVEFALNLQMSLKVRNGFGTKYLMKKILYDMVPRQIFERPKRGFAIPLDGWLRTDLKAMLDTYLSDENVRMVGAVNPAYVRSLLKEYFQGKRYLYNRVWVLLVLHWWWVEQTKV